MTTSDPGSARQPLRLVIAVIATLALVVVVVGIGVVIDRHGHRGSDAAAAAAPSASAASPGPTGSEGASGSPAVAAAASVADSYYAAVKKGDARAAYRLLCARQRIGYAGYAARVALNTRTGTGVTTFRPTGIGTVSGQLAAVPGEIGLANGQSTPIVVILAEESDHWKVCSSNLGGVLPAPGTAGTPSPSATPGDNV